MGRRGKGDARRTRNIKVTCSPRSCVLKEPPIRLTTPIGSSKYPQLRQNNKERPLCEWWRKLTLAAAPAAPARPGGALYTDRMSGHGFALCMPVCYRCRCIIIGVACAAHAAAELHVQFVTAIIDISGRVPRTRRFNLSVCVGTVKAT
ncbi:hypothetical protein EVAR_18643_1 [Eumeta japonica]|uniref:Uncharacterized protein n=1 Tax=Eumeta variegata TaxID=151549 RepID=A0A4C1U6K6_EUMVA|nr:hypothetical protein EVAR_18643_1 [Eumeta japonica]